MPVVRRVVEIAKGADVPVILNPSPLAPEFLSSGIHVHTLIVNEPEVLELTGMPIAAAMERPELALSTGNCRQLVITRGAKATVAITNEQTLSIAPPSVVPVDTVGAGDSFAGAFAVAFAEGASLERAIRFANAAGALATLKPGAQGAIPYRQEIEAFVRND